MQRLKRRRHAQRHLRMRLQRLPERPLEHVVFHHIAQARQLQLSGIKRDVGIFPLPGFKTAIGVRAHFQHRLPDAQPAQQIDGRRADRGYAHIRFASGIEGWRSSLFNYRYLKSLLRQPQRQRAADHTAADNGNFGV